MYDGNTNVVYGSFCLPKRILYGGKKLKEYLTKYQDVLKEQETTEQGLSSAEVQAREAKYGKNKLAEGKKATLLQRFLGELADPMIIILIAAAVVSGAAVVVSAAVVSAATVVCAAVVSAGFAEQPVSMDIPRAAASNKDNVFFMIESSNSFLSEAISIESSRLVMNNLNI